MAAIARTTRTPGTANSAGAIRTTSAATAYDRCAIIRDPLYQGTIRALPWRNWPTGIASRNPPIAGMAVSRLTSNADPPSRTMKTARNGVTEEMTPMAIESPRIIRWLCMSSDSGSRGDDDRRPGRLGRPGMLGMAGMLGTSGNPGIRLSRGRLRLS